MGIFSKIKDGWDSGAFLKITKEGAANVIIHPHPPIDDNTYLQPFRARFSNKAGATEMKIDGTTNPDNVFSILSDQKYDIYIKTIFVEISDGGNPNLNKFGDLSALTTGVEWLYYNPTDGEYILHEGIKTNKEFIRLGIDTHGIGTGADAYLADVSGGGTQKSYLPIIDMAETYGMKYGLKLRKETTDRVSFRINDNLTGLAGFDAIAYGFRLIHE